MLLNAVLDPAAPGEEVDIAVASRSIALELEGWLRVSGHEVVREGRDASRWLLRARRGAGRRVLADALPDREAPLELADGTFPTPVARASAGFASVGPADGFVPLGALAEASAPAFHWRLADRDEIWADGLDRLVDGATAAQWDAVRDIPWDEAGALPDHLERAVCQVMTYIAQNEYAAYYVPAQFLGQVHPAHLEMLMWLASHVRDEARHIEVFTKRALAGGAHGYALASTQRSLHALVHERDFTSAALLLNVLGEGSFLDLLDFVAEHAPDAATRAAARLAHRDELRHVHFGLAHVRRALGRSPSVRERLVAAVEARAAHMAGIDGLSPIVVEALTLMAAGSLQPADLSEGAAAVRGLMGRLAGNRVERLRSAGLDETTARHISDLHTPNLM